MLLLDAYKNNVNKRFLFSKFIDIDFYDGPTEAMCQLVDSEQWFICSLVYFDINKDERIFTLLEVNNEWLVELKLILETYSNDTSILHKKLKEKVNLIYKIYSGKVFLFRSDSLAATEYEVVQIPLKDLKYFKGIEDVLDQTEESKLQWVSFFKS